MELLGAFATGIAVFCLLMALFAPALAVPQRAEAVRAAALPRHSYQRLVSAERPVWERLLAPLAARIGERLPGMARQVDERLIVRAGLDPAVLSPAEVYAAKLVAAVGVLIVAAALTPLFGGALIAGLILAYGAYVFPTEYLGWRARRRKAQLLRELPDFMALVRPLAEPGRMSLEHAFSETAAERCTPPTARSPASWPARPSPWRPSCSATEASPSARNGWPSPDASLTSSASCTGCPRPRWGHEPLPDHRRGRVCG